MDKKDQHIVLEVLKSKVYVYFKSSTCLSQVNHQDLSLHIS